MRELIVSVVRTSLQLISVLCALLGYAELAYKFFPSGFLWELVFATGLYAVIALCIGIAYGIHIAFKKIFA